MELSTLQSSRSKWLLLSAMIISLAMTFIDQSGIPVALPNIQDTLDMTNDGLQWILNAYLMSLAAFIIAGGKLSDRFGHKNFFYVGTLLFLSASFLCGYSHRPFDIIFSRGLQGIGAALMIPAGNALLTNLLPPDERGKMRGISIAIASIFLAVGPLIGGTITQFLGWQWLFWLNIPLCALCLVFMRQATSELSNSVVNHRTKEKVDFFGLAWLVLSITPLIFALTQGATLGWTSAQTVTLLTLSLLSLSVLIKLEKTRRTPLLDLHLFADVSIRVAIIFIVITQFAIISIAYWPIFLHSVMGYSAGWAGLALVPVTIPIMLVSPTAGAMCDQKGPRHPAAIGTICLVIGSLWISLSSLTHQYLLMLPGLFIYGCGPSFLISSIMTFVFNAVEPQKRGIITGFTSFFRQVGSAVGMAVISAIFGNILLASQTQSTLQHAHAQAFMWSTLFITLVSGLLLLLLRYIPNQAYSVDEVAINQMNKEPSYVTD